MLFNWKKILMWCLVGVVSTSFAARGPHAKDTVVDPSLLDYTDAENVQEALQDLDTWMGGTPFNFFDLGDVNPAGVQDGNFFRWDAPSSKMVPTESSVTAHTLMGSTHSDTEGDPTFGDSIMWDGDNWIPGRWGDWAYDMEYVAITNVTGVIGSNGLSGVTGLSFDSGYANVTGSATYVVNNFSGPGLDPTRIRGVYIYARVSIYATNPDRVASLQVTYPDGSTQTLLKTDYQIGQTQSATWIEQTVFVPVNVEQESFTISADVNYLDHSERVIFNIIGAQCSKRINLSPDIDVIYLKGAATSGSSVLPSVGANTTSIPAREQTWISTKPDLVHSNNFTDVFPIVVPNSVSKTIIKGYMVQDSSDAATADEAVNENFATTTITIDWNNDTVSGFYHINHGVYAYTERGYIKGTLDDINIQSVYLGYAGNPFQYDPSMLLGNRTIVELPLFDEFNSFEYEITHFKTIGSSMERETLIDVNFKHNTPVDGLISQGVSPIQRNAGGELDFFPDINYRNDMPGSVHEAFLLDGLGAHYLARTWMKITVTPSISGKIRGIVRAPIQATGDYLVGGTVLRCYADGSVNKLIDTLGINASGNSSGNTMTMDFTDDDVSSNEECVYIVVPWADYSAIANSRAISPFYDGIADINALKSGSVTTEWDSAIIDALNDDNNYSDVSVFVEALAN